MPVLGGFDAARQIKADVPKARIVFITAYEDAELAEESFRIGASFVLKRSTETTLLRTVLKAFSQVR